MKSKRFFRTTLPFLCLALLASRSCLAQTAPSITWAQDLSRLDTMKAPYSALDKQEVSRVQFDVENWHRFHPTPNTTVIAAPAGSPSTWSDAATTEQITALHLFLTTLIKDDPNHPFTLGQTDMNVVASATVQPPLVDSINQTTMQNLNAQRASDALNYLPGVSIQHLAANRNEAGILIRGFSTRGQVPLYLDGIPVYVPYDGYVDLNRFLTSDLAEIQVSRGYSSPLMGPNNLGGSINFVTREPVKKYQADMLIGTGSGNTLLSSLYLGQRYKKFYYQGTLDWLSQDYFPISGNYALSAFQPTDQRNVSDTRDEKWNGRVGWTPRAADEYTFSYINQKGQKGVPTYAGPNSAAVINNYWYWPYWNKDSYYFLSNTGVGQQSSLKTRIFYDQFRNDINMYDNATYTTMNKPNSEISRYDDHTDGASADFTTHLVPGHTIDGSFFFKDDTHREYGIYPGRSPFPLVTPDLVDRDQQTSIGLQDSFIYRKKLTLTGGFSANHLEGLQAEAYNSTSTAVAAVTCETDPTNTKKNGCQAHEWSYNPQVAASYTMSQLDTFYFTFSHTSRFPMLKDLYSYSEGKGIPNPNLQTEHANNWNIGYARRLPGKTVARVDLFRSNLHDAIESVYVTDTQGLCDNVGGLAGLCNQNFNIGREVHEGVETSIHSAPLPYVEFDTSYSYLNRDIVYDFSSVPTVNQPNTSLNILPTEPRNKLITSALLHLPHQSQLILLGHVEGGLVEQDTTYSSKSPNYRPFSQSLGLMDIEGSVPVYKVNVQVGVHNVFDEAYQYVPGFPEEGRNWFFNLRYHY